MLRHLRNAIRVFSAFFRLGMRLALSYPLSFVMSQLALIVPVVAYYFVAKLVGQGHESVGGDYYSFAMIGLVGSYLMMAGLQSFGNELTNRVQQGQFEMLLTEPVSWRMLPIGVAAWPVSWQVVTSFVALLVSVALGATFRPEGAPLALLIAFLGLVAGLSIGVVSGSVRVLSKGSDPVLAIYTLFVGILSGVLFPIALLPPVLRAAAWLLPNTYMVYGLRSALLPGGATIEGPSGLQAVLFLSTFDLLVFPFAIAAFGRSLEAGRRLGVLAGY